MKFFKTLRCDINKTFVNIGFVGAVGLTFLLIPRVADWLVEKATDLGTTLVAFLLG